MDEAQTSEGSSRVAPDASTSPRTCWYALRTRSRQEKVVTAQLHDKGISTFLPLSVQVHRWSDRSKTVEVPLFPGYTFVRLSPSTEVCCLVLRTVGVVGFVGIQGRAFPIPDKEIEDIQTLMASKLPVEPYPFIRCGDWVRVKCGPLEGIEGILVRKKNVCSLVLSVEMLGRSAAVEVDASIVERVAKRSGGPHVQRLDTISSRTRNHVNPTGFAGQSRSISGDYRRPSSNSNRQGHFLT
jgi:transcription antitermination factor NusG